MTASWPPNATDEERKLRLFKDALMRRSMAAVGALLSPEGEEELLRRTAEVEDAYARVSEHTPEELKGDAAPTRGEVLTALRMKGGEREEALPPRRVLVHMLAATIGYGEEDTTAKPFTPPLKKVFTTSVEAARRLGHDYVGAEHLLLALASEPEGVAAGMLADLEVGPEELRTEVMEMIDGGIAPGSSQGLSKASSRKLRASASNLMPAA